MWLKPIPAELRDRAVDALNNGDVIGFLCKADNHAGLALVAANLSQLRARELYEVALLNALVNCRVNNHRWPMRDLAWLIKKADPRRLRAAGDLLPGVGPFTLYRGVAGRGPARRIRGLSWTSSRDRAMWFANRFTSLFNPAVYTVSVEEADVLAYLHENFRSEEEFLVLLPPSAKPKREPIFAFLQSVPEKGNKP